MSVKLNDTVTFRIPDRVGKYSSTRGLFSGSTEVVSQLVTVKDVVAQYQCARILSDEVRPDDESLCNPLRGWLHGVGDAQAPITAVTQQQFESRCIFRRGDNQNVPDPSQHQYR